MISYCLRRWLGPVLNILANLICRTGLTPAMLSVGGLIAMMAAGLAFARNYTIPGGSLVLIGGLLDSIDGEVARAACVATESGAFVDSICDHLGDFAIYLGLGWRAIIIGDDEQILILLAASFGSLFGSLVRARATLFHIDLKQVGIATRGERLLIVVIGSFGACLRPALWMLALLTNISAMQRLWSVVSGRRNVVGATSPQLAEPLSKQRTKLHIVT